MLASDPHSASWDSQLSSCLMRLAPGIPSDVGLTSITGGAVVVVGADGSATAAPGTEAGRPNRIESAAAGAVGAAPKAGVAPTSPETTNIPITTRRRHLCIESTS